MAIFQISETSSGVADDSGFVKGQKVKKEGRSKWNGEWSLFDMRSVSLPLLGSLKIEFALGSQPTLKLRLSRLVHISLVGLRGDSSMYLTGRGDFDLLH